MENKFNDSTSRAKRARILTPALALWLGLGVFASSDALVFGQQAQQQSPQVTQTRLTDSEKPTQLASPAELSRAFINVAKRIKPAVVHINVVGSIRRPASADDLEDLMPFKMPFDMPLDRPLEPTQAQRENR